MPAIYAIGDVHGYLSLLNKLLDKIEVHAGNKPYQLVFLGDYGDRGPSSKQVIDRLIELRNQKWKYPPVFLKGNHEQAMLQMIDQNFYWTSFGNWMEKYGGRETLKSYGVDVESGNRNSKDLSAEFKKAVGQAHYKFLQDLPLSFQTEKYFLCHAGVNFDRPLDQQTENDLLWIRDEFLFSDKEAKKIIVHGHTITEDYRPFVKGNRIAIDTGVYKPEGSLTACRLEDGKVPQFIMTR